MRIDPQGWQGRVRSQSTGSPPLTAGRPEALFDWSFYGMPLPGPLYDLIVVQNWFEELQRLVPTD